MKALTIGALARAAGVSVETIRYYQRRKLLRDDGPRQGAFRVYESADLIRLRFIRRAQTLGFSLDEIAELLRLDEIDDRVEARAMAQARLEEVERRIGQLNEIRDALASLVSCCEHTESPAPCPILHTLLDDGFLSRPPQR
ncbi:MAG: MerR family DNA-binding protein [Zoogloeaceae bacterium]|nr:MerR family DNA-binding protein [Rhodocyclaceae bacterium]MCP5231617.1 MerR family DNA-binding protein [Zoogloeaceae bacterium]MCP5254830.1 MerR family DNA-binding protein [Zoogloeaceae bacterium]MCP5294462.1 MerR family DNA-binding protein [Zoogloeaceae bacterium]MCW5613558.1 MerR family DNA-binding protein [Rhodocyclaceae bacterium]